MLYTIRCAVGESSWLVVDPWEITRRRVMDYLSVLKRARQLLEVRFPAEASSIRVLYLCKANQVIQLTQR
jgi:hypothetical protein